MMKFAVFASGEGTNLQAIIEAVKAGQIKAELALVFSDQRKANVLKRAEGAGIKTLFLNRKDYATPQSYERDIAIYLKREEIDFIVLAGYMRILTPFLVKQFSQKIFNIHPSLLPSFKGLHGIRDAFTYGVKVTGVTVHVVDDKMDHGPIILQEAVEVTDKDTLETLTEKIHTVEHKLYLQAIQLFEQGCLRIGARKVEIKEAKK